jgi:hypothetical protein
LLLRITFGGQQPHLEAFQTESFEKHSNLSRAASDARQGLNHRNGFVDRVRWMGPQMRFKGLTLLIQPALGAIKIELFQRFYTPGLIYF